jgi:hypothetical protein
MLNNQVITDTNQQLSNNLAGMYNNAYNQAQNTQNNALGQYGSIMNMPLAMSQGYANQVGNQQQHLNQRIMNDAKGRYDFNSMNPYRNLEMYRNMISGNMGGAQNSMSSGSSTTTAPPQSGGGSNIGSVLGMAAGAYFGGPQGAAIGGQAGGMIGEEFGF